MFEHLEETGWRWKFEDEGAGSWRIQKHRPKWYVAERDTDVVLEPIFACSKAKLKEGQANE